MNARTLIFTALGGLVLVAALVFTRVGDDARPADSPAAGTPAAELGDGADDGALSSTSGGAGGAIAGTGSTTADLDAAGMTAPRSSGDGSSDTRTGGSSAAPAGGSGSAPAGGSGTATESSTPPPTSSTDESSSEASSSDRSAQDPVAAILRATAARYEAVRALQADFEQQLTNTLLGRTTRSAGTLYQRQPDRFLMRFSDPAGDVIVSDGEYFWLYYPSVDPKQVIRTARGAGGLDLRSQFVGDPVRRFEAVSHGRETVRGRAAHVLTLTPREPMGYRSLKVWIDAEDHLVRRFELREENGNVRRFELTDLRINPTLGDALFAFDPPAGAVVVTR